MKLPASWLRTLLLAAVVGNAIPAAAGIQIDGLKLRVATGSLEVSFEAAAVTGIRNLITGEQYIVRPGPSWLQVKLLEGGDIRPQGLIGWQTAFDPRFGSVATLNLWDAGITMRMQVGIDPARDEIFVRVRGGLADLQSSEPFEPGVISALWGITGLSLNPGRLVIPAQAGTYFDLTSRPDLIGLDFPVHWEHGFVIYESNLGGFMIYADDDKPFFKRLHASRQTGNLDMALEYFAPAPWKKAREVPEHEWRLSGFRGNWREPASRYKEWLSGIRPNMPAEGNRAWVKDIRGVVTLQTRDSEVLEILAAKLIPEKTLLYVVDWRSDPYDVNYPDYTPGDNVKELVDRAHELGFRVMAHVNLLGVSQTNPHYASMKDYQIKSGHELEPLGWLWNLPEDHPLRIAYISPAASAYRRLFIDSIRPAIEELDLDALHLDAGGAIVNDGNGLIEGMTSIDGIMQIHRDLLQEFPDLVLGGESTSEVIAPFNWVAQRWTSESPPHPVSTFLLGDQVHFYGFLDQPIPDYPGYIDYLKRYEGQGILPTLHVTNILDLAPERVRTNELIDQMKLWQEAGFEPDWESPWEGRLFVFRGAGGRTAAVEADGGGVRLRIDGRVHYERAGNAATMETERFIENWPAYDNRRLYGLNPERQYFLESAPYRPTGMPHLRELPPNVSVGMNTLVTPAYGYFELDAPEVAGGQFDFVESFKDTQSGTIYGGRDYPLIYGATSAVTQLVVGGEFAPRVLLTAPPYRGPVLGGAVYTEYRVAVPEAPKVNLAFDAALADGTYLSDGVLMVVRINGQDKWRATMTADGWHPVEIDVSPYAGEEIVLRLIAHPGIRGNPFLDWACWTNLRFLADFDRPGTPLPVELPAPGQAAGVSENAAIDWVEDSTAQVRLDLPGSFVLFAQPPQPAALNESLLDLTFDLWRADYDGLPYPSLYENSGEISLVTSGGVEKRSLSTRPARDSVTVATFPVRLPADARQLSFAAGLMDPPTYFGDAANYTGVKMSVRINTTEVWSEEIREAGWKEAAIDLRPWAGRDVLIRLSIDSLESATFDWGQWAELRIE